MEQSPTKKCPHCQKDIDPKATKCPHCQSDLRNFLSRHPIVSIILGLVCLSIIFSIIGASGSGTSSSSTQGSAATTPQVQDLTAQNNPTIKQIGTVPTDYVGQSFVLYVNAEAENYYNYGFSDATQYYSLKVWDSSVQYDSDGVYAYVAKDAKSKALFNALLNNSAVMKIHASIPRAKYEDSSNAFLQIDSWEYAQ